MDNIDCPICGIKNIDKKHPYSLHKIKYKDFIEKYYPRKDLFSKEKIEFKSLESYFLTDFKDKRNLKKYLETIDKNKALEYLQSWLLRRKKNKINFDFNLTQFEIRSLMFPSIKYIENFFGSGSYKKICLDCGIQYRNNYEYIPKFNKDISNKLLFQDTREQRGILLSNMEIKKLPFGDYCIENGNLYLERKSLNDFLNTMSSGYTRFNNEILRCKEAGGFLLVIIEESYKNLQSFEYMPHIHSKCSWSFISHRVRELISQFPLNLQFLAVDGRLEIKRVIEKIFKIEHGIGIPDFQYLYDIGEL